ncbi:YesL family protein [Bifidobacterium sp. ESL0764]|uniref:YesL family protein n=1 Tax=Bifidobacterium sp. ESL0764 TaxID=2983228 RepID=UPI0023FA26F3|nr:YesL family protein [Bifidobacterium sp. ESL0764]WEV66228.1 YesL family protein [Bifidobacterium sp. ESL0764]
MHFNINSPFWRFMTLCVRYFILNLLFLLTCIPIITIASARTALYSTVFAYDDHEDINLGGEYLHRFAREFLRSLAAFLIFALIGAIIVFALSFWNSLGSNSSYIVLPVLVIAGIILLMTFEFYCPLQARFENSFKATLLNALRIPWATFGKTLAIVAIDIAAIALFVFTKYVRIACLLLGFSWLAYAKSLIYLKIFEQIGQMSQRQDHLPDTSGPISSKDNSIPTASLM